MLGISIGLPSIPAFSFSAVNQAIALLRRLGTNANIWLPGVGAINGLQAGDFILSDGSTGAAVVDGPVGLVLDANGSVGSELSTVQSASPSVTTGNVCVSASNSVAGGKHLVTYTYNITAGTIQASVGSGTGPVHTAPVSGTYSGYVDSTTAAAIKVVCVGATGSISGFSVKQVTGVHASQATTANKPVLRRGAYNLVARSNELEDPYWATRTNVSVTPGISDPDGGTSAFTLTATSAGSVFGKALTAPIGTVATGSLWIRRRTGTGIVNLVVGENLTTDITSSVTASWQRLDVTGIPTTTTNCRLYVAMPTAGDEVDVCRLQLVVGPEPGDYSPTTTVAASNPDAGKYSWQFDGVNDSLSLGSALLQLTDDCAVIAGAVCHNPSNNPSLISPAYGGGSANVALLYIHTGPQVIGTWDVDVSAPIYAQSGLGSLITGKPFVGSTRKVGSSCIARHNGVSGSAVSVPVGACTVTSAAIGGRYGGLLNGNISCAIVVKATLTDAELLLLERLAAALTPDCPSF